MRTTSTLFLLPLLLAACPSPTPVSQLPVQIPSEMTLEAESCGTMYSSIDSGASGVPFASHAPSHATFLSAQCEDGVICAAEIQGHDRSSVLLRGKSPGETFLSVTYEHPATHEQTWKKVKVTITTKVQGDALHPVIRHNVCPPSMGDDASAPQ